jgi:hypothetical protein
MVIGNGLMANTFKDKYKNNDEIIIFASGVSNSSEKDKGEYKREFNLLKKYEKYSNKLIYFSTASIFDPSLENSEYIKHKRKVESYIKKHFESFLIFRLPIVISHSNNPNTFFQHFKNAFKKNKNVIVRDFAKRYIIDIEDVKKELPLFIENYSNITINVAYDNRESVFKLAELMKAIMISESKINSESTPYQSNYIIDNDIFLCKCKTPDNYNKNVLKKYLNGSIEK